MKRRIWLVARAIISLTGALALLIGMPALLAWLWSGGSFGWPHLLVGIGVAVVLLTIGGLILGWALGRRLKGD
ncbi:hypothetical protein [Chloroflexus sp.]|uniref:hypothetical protein n=1 Tax=Chloroflexus sp. TaxID=1904827 RepID=UPI002602992D|nr:hypothetical protein [uncultured Chloroflexus sp.]